MFVPRIGNAVRCSMDLLKRDDAASCVITELFGSYEEPDHMPDIAEYSYGPVTAYIRQDIRLRFESIESAAAALFPGDPSARKKILRCLRIKPKTRRSQKAETSLATTICIGLTRSMTGSWR